MAALVERARRMPADILILAVLTVVIFVAMGLLLNRSFLNFYNFQSLMFSAPELGLLAIAMMLSMLPGGIDLSIVAIANLAAVIAALFFKHLAAMAGVGVDALGPEYVLAGIGLALAVGAAAGAINGLLIVKLRVTPILATIGTSQLFLGFSLVLTGGPAIQGFPAGWTWFGNATVLAIPVPMLILVAALVLVAFALRRATGGVSLKFIGTSQRAAFFTGIRTDRFVFLTFVACAMIASIAGILISARTNAARADYGSSYLLVSVLVAVLGGTNPGGGRATVVGVALALVALTILSSGFQMLRFSNFLVEMIWGGFLLAVLAIQFFRNYRARTRNSAA